MEIQYGMLLGKFNESVGENNIKCTDSKCRNRLRIGDTIFIDTFYSTAYCENCGRALRYHRKKAHQRGEDIRDIKEQP